MSRSAPAPREPSTIPTVTRFVRVVNQHITRTVREPVVEVPVTLPRVSILDCPLFKGITA